MNARQEPAGRVRTCRAQHFLLVLLLCAAHASGAYAQGQYDVILRNARVLDGTGNPWYYADVGITGERIAAVGSLPNAQASQVIDAGGLYLAPGFIDVHSHAGPGLATRELSAAVPLLAQGITTVFINPDGGGSSNMEEQKQALLRDGLGVNVALLVPHGSVRRSVLDMADRAPATPELERMRTLVRQGMEAGAFGLSSGPFYAPGSYAKTDELVELAKVASSFGGVYTSHVRDESDYSIGVVAAVDEVIEISRQAALPGVVTHIKALGPNVWGYSAALVHRIERARGAGVEVYADQYPYEASSTGLSAALVPRWAQAGGQDSLDRRLGDAAQRARIRAEMVQNLERRGGPSAIMFARFSRDPSLEGRTLAQVAAQRNMDPIDAAIELVTGGGPSIISFNMNESDVKRLMQQPWTMTASDGDLVQMGRGVPHPRAYGTFPRRIRKYVIEEGVTDLAQAIRSMTSLPATVFRMRDRGVIREGAIADIVLFDLERIRDVSRYEDPHHLSEGVTHVLIGGQFAVRDGQPGPALYGRVLDRRQ